MPIHLGLQPGRAQRAEAEVHVAERGAALGVDLLLPLRQLVEPERREVATAGAVGLVRGVDLDVGLVPGPVRSLHGEGALERGRANVEAMTAPCAHRAQPGRPADLHGPDLAVGGVRDADQVLMVRLRERFCPVAHPLRSGAALA